MVKDLLLNYVETELEVTQKLSVLGLFVQYSGLMEISIDIDLCKLEFESPYILTFELSKHLKFYL